MGTYMNQITVASNTSECFEALDDADNSANTLHFILIACKRQGP